MILEQDEFMVSMKLSKNKIYNLLFFGYLVFMGTTLKLTLGLTSISFFANAAIIILPILIIAWSLRSVTLSTHDMCVGLAVVLMILIPLLNMLVVSRSYIGIVQTMSFIFPWLVLLSVIFNQEYVSKNQAKFLRWFNNFSIVFIFLGLLEYILVFFFDWKLPIIETANGDFYAGYFTVFHVISDSDLPHFRFYGPFGEPGSLAMYASILIFYNLLRKNYLALTIVCIGAFAAFSPSILVSLLIAFIIYFIKIKKIYNFLLVFTIISSLVFYFGSDLINFGQGILSNKQSSLLSRYESTAGFFTNLGFLTTNYPVGIPAFKTSAEAHVSGISFAANFTAITAFERGGIIVFALYLLLLGYGAFNSIVAILGSKKSLIFCEIYLYYLLFLPFVVQREGLFEMGIFSLLFGSVFFRKLRRSYLVTV